MPICSGCRTYVGKLGFVFANFGPLPKKQDDGDGVQTSDDVNLHYDDGKPETTSTDNMTRRRWAAHAKRAGRRGAADPAEHEEAPEPIVQVIKLK